MRSREQTRIELHKDNGLLRLLDDLRRGNSMSDSDREMLWLGVSDFAYHLAKKHYGEPQKTFDWGQWTDAHYNRVETILTFVKESDTNTPIKGIVFSIHRRYAWIELIVEMKTLGVSYLEEMSVTKRINSIFTKEIIKGNKIIRRLTNEYRRIPTHHEIVVEYTRQLMDKGETVSYARIKRFSERFRAYQEAKNRTSCLSFDETYFIGDDADDSDF